MRHSPLMACDMRSACGLRKKAVSGAAASSPCAAGTRQRRCLDRGRPVRRRRRLVRLQRDRLPHRPQTPSPVSWGSSTTHNPPAGRARAAPGATPSAPPLWHDQRALWVLPLLPQGLPSSAHPHSMLSIRTTPPVGCVTPCDGHGHGCCDMMRCAGGITRMPDSLPSRRCWGHGITGEEVSQGRRA
jgi:hypothetical protein